MNARRTLVQSPAARDDLLDIYESIAAERPKAADKLFAKINAAIERIREFPASAAESSDIAPGLRALTVAPYLILYRFDADAVLVVRVVHGARDRREIDLGDPHRR